MSTGAAIGAPSLCGFSSRQRWPSRDGLCQLRHLPNFDFGARFACQHVDSPFFPA